MEKGRRQLKSTSLSLSLSLSLCPKLEDDVIFHVQVCVSVETWERLKPLESVMRRERERESERGLERPFLSQFRYFVGSITKYSTRYG